MNKTITEDEAFQNINFSKKEFAKGDYENCRFVNCIFQDSDLSGINFVECKFDNCDLSMAKMKHTALKTVKFKGCKLLGLNFGDCNTFLLSVYFEDCLLNLASFYKLKLKGTKFINCSLQEVDFAETDLTGSAFEKCDLYRAIFDNTNLERADFRSSVNYSINPEINRIKKAKFSRMEVIGLLDKYDIEIE